MTNKSFNAKLRLIDTLSVETGISNFVRLQSDESWNECYQHTVRNQAITLYQEFNKKFTPSYYVTKLEDPEYRRPRQESTVIRSTLKIYELQSRQTDLASKIRMLLQEEEQAA